MAYCCCRVRSCRHTRCPHHFLNMGCLIVILVIAGIVTLPSILGPLIFWSLAAVIYWRGQSQSQAVTNAREMKRIALLSAPPEVQRAEAEREEAERKSANRLTMIKVAAVGGILLVIWIASLGGHHSSTVEPESPSPTPFETVTPVTTVAESTPEPSSTTTEVRKAIPVITSPTSTPFVEIPSPSDDEAITAFNDLQDQFNRPHIDKLYYTGSTDSYNWIGPKTHKKMSMKRRQFNEEIWQPYWKKTHQQSQ